MSAGSESSDAVPAGSFSRAAERLQIRKPTLSRKLRQLERQIGAVLLKRGTRGMEITEVGRALLLHCQQIATTALDVSHMAAEMQSLVRGTVRVSMPFGLDKSWVSEAIATFAPRHPEVNFVIHETNRWVDGIDERYDVAIHVGRAKNLDIPTRRLAVLPRGLYASPQYCERRGIPCTPGELLHHDCVVLEGQVNDDLWRLDGELQGGDTLVPRMVTTDIILARETAAAGVGIATLTHVICETEVREGRLRRVLPDWSIPPVVIAAMFPERRYVPARVRAFINCISECLQKSHPHG